MIRAREVDLATASIVKMWPTDPPSRGDILLVNCERVRVTRAKVSWSGNRWTLHRLKVKPAP